MTLITGKITLVRGEVTCTLITHSYMRKTVAKFLDRALSEQVGDRTIEICGLSVSSHGFPISTVLERLLDRALSE